MLCSVQRRIFLHPRLEACGFFCTLISFDVSRLVLEIIVCVLKFLSFLIWSVTSVLSCCEMNPSLAILRTNLQIGDILLLFFLGHRLKSSNYLIFDALKL